MSKMLPKNLKKQRYQVRVLACCGLLGLFVFLVNVVTEYALDRTLLESLTEPLSSWTKENPSAEIQTFTPLPTAVESKEPTKPSTESVTFAQEAPEANPEESNSAVPPHQATLPETAMSGTSEAYTNESSQHSTTIPMSDSTASETITENYIDTDAAVDSTPSLQETRNHNPTAISPNAQEVLDAGRALVEGDVLLPVLNVDWRLNDIEELVIRGLGRLVASSHDRSYYAHLTATGTIQNAEYFALTAEAAHSLSNLALPLNRRAPFRQQFEPIANRLRQRKGLGPIVSFDFRPSHRLAKYLAYKQAGTIAALGLDLEMLAAQNQPIETRGELRITQARVFYLIREVRVGEAIYAWNDPEAALADPDPES